MKKNQKRTMTPKHRKPEAKATPVRPTIPGMTFICDECEKRVCDYRVWNQPCKKCRTGTMRRHPC